MVSHRLLVWERPVTLCKFNPWGKTLLTEIHVFCSANIWPYIYIYIYDLYFFILQCK